MAPDHRTTFLAAAGSFVTQVTLIPAADLSGPGLGDWDLRSLVGHAARALVTVETYLDRPADRVEVDTAAEYYVAIQDLLRDSTDVVERGRVAGESLGEDPSEFVAALAERVRARLDQYDDSYLLDTIAGPMRLAEYLRTRTFELVVHGFDIAAATGLHPTYDASVLADATTLAAEAAALLGHGREVVLALTGRTALPGGFSVV